jgi:hypothetical protein
MNEKPMTVSEMARLSGRIQLSALKAKIPSV